MEFINCMLYLLIISIVIYLLGRILPYSWINEYRFPFRSYDCEKEGKIYERLNIKKWKNKLPDASRLISKIVKKVPSKSMGSREIDKIPLLIKETCKAEITHVVAAIAGFYCCKIWKKYGWMLSLAYFLSNVPFVIIQRYNRPRLIKASSAILR